MSFLAMDDPAHLRLRTLVSKGFTPRRIRELEARVTEIAVQHLDTMLDKANEGTVDYVDEFAGKLPMDVISELMGVPDPDRAHVRAWADGVMHREDGVTDVPPEAIEASLNLIVYYQEMVAERRKKPTDDLTTALLEAEIDGDRLTDDEILGFMFLMVIAGNETTTKLLANAAFWGHKNPDQLTSVYADPSRVPLWVEETLRYDTSSQILARTVVRRADPLRHHDSRRRRPAAAARFRAPRRARIRQSRRLRDRTRHRFQTIEFRQRRALLPGRALGADGSPGRPHRVVQANPRLRGRRGQLRPCPFQQCPRVRTPTDDRGGLAEMPRFEPLPERRPAIVAGASSGIGEATAIELAAHGFPVALGARRVEKLDDIVGKINADGGEAVGFHLDVTDPNSVKSFVAQSVDALGDIEVLVAGAGDTYFGKLAEITTDEFESQLQIHLIGANRLASAVLPGMLDRQRGDLIFVGSDVALRQRPHMGAYGAAKAALVAMVNNFQMELEGTGVRASIVHPGPTKTSMGWSLPAEKIGPALEDWAKWGQARHDYFLRAADLGRAITFVAETPRGGFIANMELQPEAPLAVTKDRQKLALGEEGMPGQ